MPLSEPSPVACDPVVASLAQLAELERHGWRVLTRGRFDALARQAADLYAALYVLQGEGCPGAERVDNTAIEDLCGLFQRLAAEQARAA